MQHILFKIYNKKFKLKNTKIYSQKGKSMNINNVYCISTKRFTSSDFFHLFLAMNKAGVQSLRIINIGGDLYLSFD